MATKAPGRREYSWMMRPRLVLPVPEGPRTMMGRSEGAYLTASRMLALVAGSSVMNWLEKTKSASKPDLLWRYWARTAPVLGGALPRAWGSRPPRAGGGGVRS